MSAVPGTGAWCGLAPPEVTGPGQPVRRTFEPANGASPVAQVVIAGAFGVAQSYYAPFAQWLAQQGFGVTTFDYRGMGAARPASLRGFKADLFDWAEDYAQVVDAVHAAQPGVPLLLVGHSLGGQLPGLLRNAHKVDGLLMVATGNGYWRENAARTKQLALLLWWLLVPLLTPLFGYFPGQRIGVVGDLPAAAVYQWRRWCLKPRYAVQAEGPRAAQSFAAVRFPIAALVFADDELMTRQGAQTILSLYTNAPGRIETVSPQQFGLTRIGHLGMFRSACQPGLWPLMRDHLRALAR